MIKSYTTKKEVNNLEDRICEKLGCTVKESIAHKGYCEICTCFGCEELDWLEELCRENSKEIA